MDATRIDATRMDATRIDATPPRKALLLVNPRARAGESPLDPALAVFAEAGVTVARERFGSPGELAEVLERGAAGVDVIVVCGGDGTLRTAAAGVLASGKPLGILPMGTANDLARTLGIPTDLAEAARVIAAGQRRPIDVGDVNGHPFFNVASIGLTVRVTENLTPGIKRRFGRIGYALASLRALLDARPFSATISGGAALVRVRTLQIAVGNGRHYGGGSVVAPHAAIDDGRLDFYSLEVEHVWKLPFMLYDLRRGRHGAWREVRTGEGSAFEVRTRRPRQVSADGEIVTTTPARFTVRRLALSVMAPPVADGTDLAAFR